MTIPRPFLILSTLALGACGGGRDGAPAAREEETPSAEAAATRDAPTGTVIEVKAITDDEGNRFEPSEVEARRGDVLRIVLVSGVHNISFPADQNPGAGGLPGPGDMLQLPGQAVEIPVSFGPGEYVFQCDPHAALGMTGRLKVEDE